MTKRHIKTMTASIVALICVMPLTASQYKIENRHKTERSFETLCDIRTPLAPIRDIEECLSLYAYSADALKSENQSRTLELAAKPEIKQKSATKHRKLTARMGVNQGPTGKETWYNLDMSGVLYLMDRLEYTYEEYPYWVREDGVKMFGDYIMVAADLDVFPKGTIVECSLGTAMVVDTGDLEPYQLDIAVNWE